jgi:hypothetical protein
MTTVLKHSVLTEVERQVDDRTFGVTMYDATELDRDGESVDLGNVRAREPIPLQADHSRSVLMTLGLVRNVRAVGKRLRGVVTFAPEGVSSVADQVHRQVAAGVTNSVSIGFVGRATQAPEGHTVWKDVEVVELSFTPVPSSPGARVDERAMKRWLGQDDGEPFLEIDDEPVLEVSEELYRFAMVAAAQARSRPTAAELAGLAGWRGAHHRDDLIDVDPQLLAHAIADVAREALADIVRGETERTINRLRGRVD